MNWRVTKKKNKGSWELEKMKHPFEPRKFSSFHTKDKENYPGIFVAMSGEKIRKLK